jgi:outer membrane phospholipase A
VHLQYFNGFTESLLDYREHHQVIRLGVSFVR